MVEYYVQKASEKVGWNEQIGRKHHSDSESDSEDEVKDEKKLNSKNFTKLIEKENQIIDSLQNLHKLTENFYHEFDSAWQTTQSEDTKILKHANLPF